MHPKSLLAFYVLSRGALLCLAFLQPNLVPSIPYPSGKAMLTSTLSNGPYPRRIRIVSLMSQIEKEEETLSDVDSRVLQSILQDSKVDLNTEEDIRKLLERGTVKKVKQPEKEEESDSEYDSSVLKAFTDTKLWRKLSAQANDVAESLGIWVANKVESDIKVLAALGIFAWDRVVKDVGRALPATGTSARKILLLSNTTAYQEPEKPEPSVMEQMNKPSDEIQAVSRAILDILSGDSATSGRGLRTAAPAGSVNMAERQQRAYTQRQKIRKQEKDVTRVPGAVVDAAYELGREIRSESSPAGYKSENVRSAIGSAISEPGNILKGFQESARLAAAKRKTTRLGESSPTPVSQAQQQPLDLDQLVMDLKFEQKEIQERLKNCILKPEETWLSLGFVSEDTAFDEAGLRDVVTMMILIRDEVDAVEPEDDLYLLADQLIELRRAAEELRSRVAAASSYEIGEALWNELFPKLDSGEPALALRIDAILWRMDNPDLTKPEVERDEMQPPGDNVATVEQALETGDQSLSNNDQFSTATVEVIDTPSNLNGERPPFWAGIATPKGKIENDVVAEQPLNPREDLPASAPEPEIMTATVVSSTLNEEKGTKPSEASIAAEVVTIDPQEIEILSPDAEGVVDDDVDTAFGQAKTVTEAPEENDNEEPSLATKAALRTLDVVLFVLEKTFTVGLPRVLNAYNIASTRLDEINRNGRGSTGWKTLENAVNGKGRY